MDKTGAWVRNEIFLMNAGQPGALLGSSRELTGCPANNLLARRGLNSFPAGKNSFRK